ncbi:MAG: TIGR03905 family TSCPD domain-containing protein [Clostridia bacterium]
MPKYKTFGTCSREINFDIDENHIITSLQFLGGCRGNLQGICKLVVGQKAENVISKLEGIQCRNNTSCPDQLSKALKQYLASL